MALLSIKRFDVLVIIFPQNFLKPTLIIMLERMYPYVNIVALGV